MIKPSQLYWLGVFAVSAPVHSQQIPDAGALRQQIESGRTPELPKAVPGESPAVSPSLVSPGEATVTVSEFRFAGNARFSSEQLRQVLARAGLVNRPLTFAELQAAAAEVAQHYRRGGWVVRTYLPKQDVSAGVVTIEVMEAIFGQPKFEGSRPDGIALEFVRDRIFEALPDGEALNLATLDRTLLLLDDLPGSAISGRLAPGAKERETDLVLAVGDDPQFDGNVGVDNGGYRSVGTYRVSGSVNLNSMLGLGEQFQAQAMASEGSTFLRAAYQQPVGLSEWRAGVNASYFEYRLVSDEFKSLDAEGNSSSVGVEATYPLLRSRPASLYFGLGFDRRTFDNRVGAAVTTSYRVDNLLINLSGNVFGGLFAGGSSQGQLTATVGKVDLGDSPNAAVDAITTRVSGQFVKLRYAVQTDQALTARYQAHFSLSGQFANKNLDSSERFYLGGPNGVRAYPVSEAGGTEGHLASAELRWLVRENWVLAGFVDWGTVTVNRDNEFVGRATNNSYSLAGLGASLAWRGPQDLSAKLTWSHRLGNNPNATNSGLDQDGSLDKHRFWVTAQLPF